MLTGRSLALPIAPVLQQEDVEATVLEQSLGIVETVANIPGVPVQVKDGGRLADDSGGLFDEVCAQSHAIRGGDVGVLVGQAEGAGGLDKHAGTVGLFRVIDEGVLVVVKGPHNHHHQ